MRFALVLPLVGSFVACAGCAALMPSPDSPSMVRAMQMVSAGHTGCLPAENTISNADLNYGSGSGTWNATCRGKTYLCAAFTPAGGSQTYSCAPVPQ